MSVEDEQREWVKRVLGVSVTAGSDPFERMYEDLVQTVQMDLQLLILKDEGAAGPIEKLVGEAAGFAGRGDYETAFGYLNRATDALAQQARATRVRTAFETIPEGLVSDIVARLEQAEDRWNGALADARASADELYKELATALPDSAAGLQNVLDSYWNDMLAAITEAKAAGESADVDGVLQTMAALREEMLADDLFSYLDSNGIAVRPSFLDAFDELSALLED